MKNTNSILVLLLLIFLLPGSLAILFYSHPQWLGHSLVNKGELLTPGEALLALEPKHKWRLIFWHSGFCDEECSSVLNKLARIRLALGRRWYEVETWLISGEPTLNKGLKEQFKLEDIKFVHLSREEAVKQPAFAKGSRLFIADPGNYLILSYEPKALAQDLFKDLELLLKTTKSA